MRIQVHQTNRLPSSARHSRLFQRASRLALGRTARRSGDLNIIFVTNPEIRKLNRKHLSHDYNTDVIAFPFDSPSSLSGGLSPFGDIFVSVDQARIQAADLGHSTMRELLTLVIHGTLHLVGYDDHAPADRKRMFARQDRILRVLGY